MPDFTTLPIPYVPIGTQAAAVRSAIDAAQLSGDNSFGGLQNLAIRGPFLSDAEADANGVPVDNLYYQPNGTVRAASHLSLDLQFATDKTLTARVGPTPTFTRASGATYVGSDGLIQSAAVDEPRFDHDPVTLACKGLLIEEGRTNLLLQSENFASASWSTGTATRTSDQIAAPDGASTADLITSIDGNFGGKLAQSLSFAATTYTASVFVKKGNWRYIGITLADIANSGRVAAFDFDTETVSANGVPNATIGFQKLSSGWYRIFLTLPTTAVTGAFEIWMTTSTGAAVGPIGSGQTVYTWGAQLEAGAFPTSYIPTTTGTLARSADVCSITGGNFNEFYNQSEGTLFAESLKTTGPASNSHICGPSNGSFAEFIDLRYLSDTLLQSVTNHLNVTQFAVNRAYTLNAITRQAIAYALNDAAYCAQGGVVTVDVPPYTPPVVDRFQIGTAGSGILKLNGCVRAIRYYKKRLPDAKLQALTA